MLKKLSESATYVCVLVISETPERFINMCRYKDIELWDIVRKDEGFSANVTKDNFFKLREICRKTKSKVRVLKRKGLRFLMFKYRKHYSFIAGIMIACALLYTCSRFIWDISFEGNSRFTSGVLLDFLNRSGVHTGMFLSDVDCAAIETAIRNEYSEITWVSAKISGTKLEINIKENDVMGNAVFVEGQERDIVATSAGVVESIVTRKGTPLVKPGDTVEAGQILVSGVVKIMDDYGNHIANVYTESDADILIKSQNEYYDKLEKQHETKVYTGNKKVKHIVGFTNTDIELGVIFKQFEKADVARQVSPVKLTDSFCLPFYTGKKVYYEYNTITESYDETQAEQELNKHFLQYLKDLSENQVQIVQYDVKMYTEGECFVLGGTVDVLMPAIEYKPVTDIEIIVNEENEAS